MSNRTLRAQEEAHEAVLQMCSDAYNAALAFDNTIVQTMNGRIEKLRMRKEEAQTQFNQTIEALDQEIAEFEYMRDEAQAGIVRITEIVGSDNQPKELEDFSNVDETADDS